jgi:putative oxidoreductase
MHMQASDLGLLALRLTVGLIFAAHGAQKAFGWWNGPGYAGWHRVIERMGFWPTSFWTAVSMAVELVSGLALAVGFLTPLAAASIVGQLIVIIVRVHLPSGFFNANRGIEFPLSLGGGALALTGTGPGAISVDRALGLAASPAVQLGLLLVFVLGALALLAVPRRVTAPGGQPPAPQAQGR